MREPRGTSRPPGKGQIRPITTARFFAAAWVVLYHTARPEVAGADVGAFSVLIGLGHTAVGFFFVLSGYILARVYGVLADGAAARKFLVARVARIGPMYVLSLLLDLPRLFLFRVATHGVALAVGLTAVNLFGQCLLLQSWIPSLSSLNFPSWSVSTEASFYLAYPVVAALLLGGVARRSSGIVLLAIMGLAIGIGGLEEYLHVLGAPLQPDVVDRNPLVRLPTFGLGIALYAVHARLPEPIPSSQRPLTFVIALVGMIGAVLASRAQTQALQSALLLPIFSLVLFYLGRKDIPILSSGLAVELGEASYSIYLLHIPIWQFMAWTRPFLGSAHYMIYWTVLVAASIAGHRWFELPARRAILSAYDRVRAGRVPATLKAGIG